ncbi:32044_t:CDS:2, partial [Racocetra persica]
KIYFCDESLEEIEEFVHVLLTLQDESKELSEVDLLMTRIAELKHIIEENTKCEAVYKTRIKKLEQSDKENATLKL